MPKTDIVNMGQNPVRVTFYVGAGTDRKSEVLEIPAGGCRDGTYDTAVLASNHLKTLCARGVLKVKTRAG